MLSTMRLFPRLSHHVSLVWNRLRERMRGEGGAITMEYILIIALIAAIIIAIFLVLLWPVLEPAITSLLERIQNAINGGDIPKP